jgi:hypothetical protein
VLYYEIVMQRLILRLMVLLFALPGFLSPPWQSAAPVASITAPLNGQALQGIVTISGSAAGAGFQAAELSFAYAGDRSTGGADQRTWFLIRQIPSPVTQDVLAQWDTTTISDGVYDLQLVVTLEDGQQVSALVSQVRVRNYSPVETDTPTAVPPSATPLPAHTHQHPCPNRDDHAQPHPGTAHADTPAYQPGAAFPPGPGSQHESGRPGSYWPFIFTRCIWTGSHAYSPAIKNRKWIATFKTALPT